jgi:hypothetical protein
MQRDWQDAHGFYWEFIMPPDEPEETYRMAIRVAATHAEFEAAASGRSYLVAESTEPLAVHVFSADHPTLPRCGMKLRYEITHEGRCLRPC